jgi:glycosyltransferase involved in cell wall biosynthesis
MRRLVYYLDPAGYGGAINYVERLVARVDPSEFEVTIICPEAPYLEPFREVLAPFSVRWVGLDSHTSLRQATYLAVNSDRRRKTLLSRAIHLPGLRSGAKGLLGILGLLEESKRLRSVGAALTQVRPDLLHVNLDRFPDVSGKLAIIAGHHCGARAVVSTLHCQPQLPVFPKRIHHYFDRRALRCADRTIVVSEELRIRLLRWYGAPVARLQVIPNGAATECFERQTAKITRRELGFEPSDFLVVHVGSILPLRGQHVLAQAICNLLPETRSLRAAFVGAVRDREYGASLDELLATQPSTPFRRFGHRADAREILRLADVAVVSSFQEGHSFALLEAMALGKAIVATALDSNAESLGHGEAGLLVPPGDSHAMAAAIRRLHDDKNLRTRLGKAARKRAIRLYTEERMVDSTLDVYRSIGRA